MKKLNTSSIRRRVLVKMIRIDLWIANAVGEIKWEIEGFKILTQLEEVAEITINEESESICK